MGTIWKKAKYQLMLAPIIAYFCMFRSYPIVKSFWLSFTRWTIVGRPQFIGFANYRQLLTADPLLWISLYHNVYYTLVVLSTTIPVSIVIATCLNVVTKKRLRGTISALFYFPYIVPLVVVGVIWMDLYHPSLGLINALLKRVYLPPQPWLSSSRQAMTAISITGIWRMLGFNTIIYLAALQGIPENLYEAAVLDGASRWKCFFHITISLLRPITLFLLIINTIWAFRLFTEIYVMTANSGGPARSTYTLAFYIWKKGFTYYQMGYAAAISIVLLFIVVLVGIFQFRLGMQRWEY